MSELNDSMITVSEHETGHGTTASYSLGFILSVFLTMAAYIIVTNHDLKSWGLVFMLVGLAIAQLIVQMVFFLHLAQKAKPRWNLLPFGLMLIVVFIIVGGSLWIMYNLNYRMMPKTVQQMEQYMREQTGF